MSFIEMTGATLEQSSPMTSCITTTCPQPASTATQSFASTAKATSKSGAPRAGT